MKPIAAVLACLFASPAFAAMPAFLKRPPVAPATRPADVQTYQAVDLPLKTAGATGRVAEWLKPFDRKPETFSYTMQLLSDDDDAQFWQLTFPSAIVSPWPENNVVPCELYLPKGRGGGKVLPAAIVLDILDGSTILPRALARGMAEQGAVGCYVPMACFSARRPKGNAHLIAYRDDPTKSLDTMRQTVLDIRRAKAILASLPQVDPGRLCITGISMGGITTALAAGVDGEFDRVVPILAGGDLAAITFHARETRILRAGLEAKGMTQEDAARMLAPIDPLTFAGRIGAGHCLMVNAANDEVIPRESTDALWKAIGSPQILWAPSGHYSAGFYLPNIRQRAIDFVLGKKVERLAF